MVAGKPKTTAQLRRVLDDLIHRCYYGMKPRSFVINWADDGRTLTHWIDGQRLDLQLNRSELNAFNSCVIEMRRTAGEVIEVENSTLSESGASSLLGAAIVASIMSPVTQEQLTSQDFPEHKARALDVLIERLVEGPTEWNVLIPVANCVLTGRRASIGSVHFSHAGPSFVARWRREVTRNLDLSIGSDAGNDDRQPTHGELLQTHWQDGVIGETVVSAYDSYVAQERGRATIARTIDVINFLADIGFQHSPVMYLSGTAGSGEELSIASNTQSMSLPWRRTGTAPLELHRLIRGNPSRSLRVFSKLLRGESATWREKAVLASARLCGQARRASDPTSRYLHYAIALDALLPTERSSAHNLSMFVSHVLGNSITERAEKAKQVRDLYDIRSKVVHGEDDAVQSNHLYEIRHIAISTLLKVALSHRQLTRLQTKKEMKDWFDRRLVR